MFNRSTWDLLALVALAFVVSYTLTAAARVVARRIGLLDQPDDGRKSHTEPIPLMGGVAVYGSLLIAVLAAQSLALESFVHDWVAGAFSRMLLVSGGRFWRVGLWDDKWGMRPRTKFLLQILATLPFVVWGQAIDRIDCLGLGLELGPFGRLFTIFWLVACANVINLVDGLDGLAGTIGLIVCLAVAVQSGMQGLFGVVPLALIVAAILFGFLWHNWPPAKVFLGDSGSLTIGFLVGALSIASSLKTATGFALVVPLVLISVPAFDTFIAIVRRKLTGRRIGEADRGHIHHCLLDRGMTRAQSLLAIAALCVVMAAVALFSAYFQNDVLALSICVLLLLLLVVGRVFGYDETILFFRSVQAVGLFLGETAGLSRRVAGAESSKPQMWDQQTLPDRDTALAMPQPPGGWNELTERVQDVGGCRLDFACCNEQTGQIVSQRSWVDRQQPAGSDAHWKIQYSLLVHAGVRATLTVSGRFPANESSQPFDELFRVFDAFCRRPLVEQNLEPAPERVPYPPVTPSLPQEQPIDDVIDGRRAA